MDQFIEGRPSHAPNQYFGELDSIRFLAFLFIFIHHIPEASVPIVSDLQRIGWIGVDIFLCLSAFLLTRLLFLELEITGRITFAKFYVRRIMRIWPLYFAYLLLVFLIINILDMNEEHQYRFFSLATFMDNIVTAFQGYNPLLATSHLWTISYEEQFYFLLPFIILFLAGIGTKGRIITVVVVVLVGLMCRILIIQQSKIPFQPAVWVLPLTHFESIMAGFILSVYYRKFFGKKILFAIVSIVSFVVLLFFANSEGDFFQVFLTYPLGAMFSFSLVTLAIISYPKKFIFSSMTRYLGRISYGLYVYHLLSLTLVYHFSTSNILVDNLVALALCILVATLSFELFEKRFLKLKGRYTVLEKFAH